MSETLLPGAVVDRWRVEELVGEGGMATVYRVRHLTLDTVAALKVLRTDRRSVRERLLREGRVQATLDHPNVLWVRDVIEVEGEPGLIMDFADGGSLEELLFDGPLPAEEVGPLFAGVVAGVAHAHARGLVHRDLKPANVLLSGGIPKVADFGLVKILEDEGMGTQAGTVLGSPSYLAPEQLREARTATPRADVFALGALLYELLSGRRAFDGPTPAAALEAVASGRYAPLDDAPRELAELVARCLSVEPEDRPAHAGALLAAWRVASAGRSERARKAAGHAEGAGRRVRGQQLAPGTEVDRYRVERLLGRGGMARVYAVTHTGLGSAHALKVLLLPTPFVRDRLLREGRAQAVLRHPNVVPVTDIVDVDGSPGLVMDHIDGPTLEDWLASHRPDAAEVEGLARGILAGVACAHRAGLVHRDLKPANILLARGEAGLVPKVTDFGLAKVLDSADGAAASGTRSGTLLGTPAYMAPEQLLSARDVDARADVWSVAAVLYELVAGRRPFEGDDGAAVLEAVRVGRHVPLDRAAPGTPRRIVDAVEGGLRVDRDQRLPSCDALLEVWSGPEKPRRARWIAWLAGVLVALPVVGFGGLYWQLSNPGIEVLELPADAIAQGTPEGARLFAEAEGVADHAGLSAAFEPQQKGSWCGVASSVIVLNARGASLTQDGFFTPAASEVRSWGRVTFGGMALEDLGGLLRAHGAEVEVHHAEDETAATFREEVARNLGRGGDWLIVNYDRRRMDEAGGGHLSPLAAWDADSDRVLLLDTAGYKYPPHWVPLERLFEAMRGLDSDSGRSRGWAVVR